MKLTVTRAAILALAVTTSVSLAACTKNNNSSSSSTSSAAAAASAGPGSSGSASAASGGGSTGTIKIGLVTKTDSNPYFVKLRESAKALAATQGAEVIALAGKFDGDNDGQVTAIENLVQQGVKGIMITPSNSAGILNALKAAQAKGILVIALDSETTPVDAVPATFATDNLQAGVILGKYIKAKIGSTAPKIITMDLDPSASVGIQRHNGFLEGMGLPDGTPPQVIGSALTAGDQTKAQSAMENLLQAHPDVNVVYSINEPAGRGAYQALTEKGLQSKVIVGSIDGSCSGVQYVKDGKFAATVMQFPKIMAEDGVKAIVTFAKTGTKPSGVVNTGATLITDKPIAGIDSKDSAWGLANCWG
ncbi:monosaccharide ABC transporter substrate-binding protein, CUT2 family [Nakamurella panacisegetis]|uniref:Monosaccharide ABC transporter substrate-binding protein, CUT2 family n=1 Tax=Nakamurella panacisegetis TaxID=1090615 RepID=A0A1H0QKS3_9ACTN|nr:substrate-binding domain-containing protein [Nakamurella panacisegetis]SDP17882.1 monosaccharide ABC transporter substrate-binding protein, CUT2 family [Nakamurella panacisegetis]